MVNLTMDTRATDARVQEYLDYLVSKNKNVSIGHATAPEWLCKSTPMLAMTLAT